MAELPKYIEMSNVEFFKWNKRSTLNKSLFIVHYLLYGIIPGMVLLGLFVDPNSSWQLVVMTLIVLAYVFIALRFEHETFPFKNIQTIGLFVPFFLGIWYARYGFVTEGGGDLLTFLRVHSVVLYLGIALTFLVGLVLLGQRNKKEGNKDFGLVVLLLSIPFLWSFVHVTSVIFQLLSSTSELHFWGIAKFIALIITVFLFHFREAVQMSRKGRI